MTASRDVFAKAAVGCDYYISDDLERIPDDYPVYIFLNSFYMPEAQREIIARRLKKDGKLLVWTYGAGLFRHGQYADRLAIGPANVEHATGIKVDWRTTPSGLDSRPVPDAPVKISALSVKGKYNPAFFVTDPEARTLAAFTAPELAGKSAVACKEMGDWKTVFVGTPEFTVALVRALAAYGGAHCYSDAEDVVIRAGNGHIVIHSGHDDTVNLFLPQKAARVVDVATGRTMAQDTDRLTLPVGKNRTVLLRLE